MSLLTEDLRRILRLSTHPGSRHRPGKSHPTISQYARWCQCSPQLLGRFARGQCKSLGHEILDDLVVLTGLFPAASEAERLARIQLADEWLDSAIFRSAFDRVRDYILSP